MEEHYGFRYSSRSFHKQQLPILNDDFCCTYNVSTEAYFHTCEMPRKVSDGVWELNASLLIKTGVTLNIHGGQVSYSLTCAKQDVHVLNSLLRMRGCGIMLPDTVHEASTRLNSLVGDNSPCVNRSHWVTQRLNHNRSSSRAAVILIYSTPRLARVYRKYL